MKVKKVIPLGDTKYICTCREGYEFNVDIGNPSIVSTINSIFSKYLSGDTVNALLPAGLVVKTIQPCIKTPCVILPI